MVEVICVEDYDTDVSNLCSALRKGIEKVISTIGIHELRGYARQFSSIGVKPELAEIFRARASAPRTGPGSGSRTSTPTPTSASRSSPARRRRSRRRRSASTPRSTRRRSRPPTAPRPTRSTRRRSATWSARARSRCATSWSCKSDRASRRTGCRGRLGRPPRLPDRDLLDELRLAVGARLPRLRRGREGDQHPLHQRGGRRDPGHVRQVPQVARAAGGLGPLRGLRRDAELLLRRRDQDRPGREARRGRPPARPQGLREGRRGAQRLAGHRPDLAVEQPRPLLDRGPRRADRRAEDREPGPAGLGEGPGRPEHRHDRRSGSPRRARTSSPSRASRAAPARRASTPCATSACRRTSAPAPCTAP